MAMNKLMEFRTAYLRLIALSWADPDGFRKALVGSSKATDTINLMMQYLKFEWPWPRACRLWFAEDEKFAFQEGQSDWIWPPGLNDNLTLYVPLSPKGATDPTAGPTSADPDISPDDKAKALAELYRERSDFFSEDWGKDWIIRGGIDSTSRPSNTPKEIPFLTVNENKQPLTGGFYPAEQEFPAFQVALLAAIALAWDNTQIITTPSVTVLVPVPTPAPILLAETIGSHSAMASSAPTISITPGPPAGLKIIITIPAPNQDSIETTVPPTTAAPTEIPVKEGTPGLSTPIYITDFKSLLTTDAKKALSLVRGYTLPWQMALVIADDTDARWDSQRSRWIYSRPNDLVLYLPSKPQGLQSEPLALSMYNGTGSAYPFSCTC